MSTLLKSEIISGGKWLVLNQAINQPLRIIIGIFLTRMLLPEDFGIVAKSFAVTGIAELVLVHGLLAAIIQDKDIKKRQIHTLFWITLFWSILVASIVYLFATTIAQFYGDDRVVWIVRITSITIVFSGVQLVPSGLIRKKLEFKKIFIAATSSGLLSSALAIYFTLHGYGYKALIYQFVINSVINGIVIIKLSDWTPKLEMHLKEVKSHIKYGLNLMGSNILNYLVRNTDDVALGRFQSNTVLGQYSRAYYLMLMPLNIINQIFNTLLFPIFSSIQDDKKKIAKIFLMTQEIIVLSMYPMIILFYFHTETIIKSILGEQWIASASLFKLFIPLLLIQLFTSPISSVYGALGKVGTAFKINLVTNPILIICIIVAAQYSAVYVAIVVVVLSGISSFIIYLIGITYLQIKFFTQNLNGLKLHIVVLCIYIGIEFLINPLFHLTSENALILSSLEIIMVYSITFYSRLHLFNYLKTSYYQK